MTKNMECFFQEFEKQFKENERANRKPGNTVYGSNVMPILKMYKSLSTSGERKSFHDALEKLLTDQCEDKRRFGILVCIGFFVFRDSI